MQVFFPSNLDASGTGLQNHCALITIVHWNTLCSLKTNLFPPGSPRCWQPTTTLRIDHDISATYLIINLKSKPNPEL